MKQNHCLLCATDFSSHAGEAATIAAKLAQRAAQKLLLVHATDDRPSVVQVLRKRLESEAARLRKSGAEVEPVLLHGGRPTGMVLGYIRDAAPSLVVVARGMKGALDRWALGSFSEGIAEASPVPTLVVRNPSAFEAWEGMKSKLTVLLALDLNASSDVVLRWAKQFQRMGPCELIAAHVNFRMPTTDEISIPADMTSNPDGVQKRLERDLKKKVRDQLGDEAVQLVVRPFFGDPGPCIVEIAAEKKAQLIAIGTHQRHGIHRLAQFSVSREVLRDATVNVLCIPVTSSFDAREAHIPEFRRVLVSTDFSELGNTAVPFACAACSIGGLVKIIHVASSRNAKQQIASGGAASLRRQLRALIPNEIAARGQPPEVDVLAGADVADAICAEAKRFGADLVCMSSHGFGLSRALHGSVTKAVLKNIRRPLLIIRRPEA